MKTTIKIDPQKSMSVEPHPGGTGLLVTFTLKKFGAELSESQHFTADQWGALMFGGEQALDAQQIARAVR